MKKKLQILSSKFKNSWILKFCTFKAKLLSFNSVFYNFTISHWQFVLSSIDFAKLLVNLWLCRWNVRGICFCAGHVPLDINYYLIFERKRHLKLKSLFNISKSFRLAWFMNETLSCLLSNRTFPGNWLGDFEWNLPAFIARLSQLISWDFSLLTRFNDFSR